MTYPRRHRQLNGRCELLRSVRVSDHVFDSRVICRYGTRSLAGPVASAIDVS